MIQTPGIIFEVASMSGKPYQLDPLAYADPETYLRETIEPFIKQGATRVFMHRMFGETVPGDKPMEYDSMLTMMNEKGNDERRYATEMFGKFHALMRKHPTVQPVIYIGSMADDTMLKLESEGHTKEWARRVWSALTAFGLMQWPLAPHYVFDAQSASLSESHTEQQWAALCLIGEAIGWHRVSMESLPHPSRPDQWGTPAYVWENDWNKVMGDEPWQRKPEMLGDVTRVLNGHGWGDWKDNGGVPAFLLDCHERGHVAFVSPRVLELNGLSLMDAVEQANKMYLDGEGY